MKRVAVAAIILAYTVITAEPLILEKDKALDTGILSRYSLSELIIIRNSIFARYGYVFKSGALQKYFSTFTWYKPDKRFSFNLLTKLDQQNVNAVLDQEKKKVSELKNLTIDKKYKSIRYYSSMKPKETIPNRIDAEMKIFWKKKLSAALFGELKLPRALTFDLSDEKDSAFINNQVKQCRERYVYWRASRDDKGVLRKLENCSCESGWPNQCNDTYYFDEQGRILLVLGGLQGTTVNYEYYYQYCLDSIVWIEVTVINGSAGIPNEMEKFFY